MLNYLDMAVQLMLITSQPLERTGPVRSWL